MAKGKNTSPAKTQSASSSRRKSATPAGNRTSSISSATVSASKSQRAISNEDIGHVAGEVWNRLASNGGQTLADLKKSIDAPTDLISAAIGWLAREDKLEFSKSGRTMKVSLR